MVYATAASPRGFTARSKYSASAFGPERVAAADQAPPLGFVTAWTTFFAPSQTFHAAVTSPFASTPTGTDRVIATPLGMNVASVDVVHVVDPAGRTATRTVF